MDWTAPLRHSAVRFAWRQVLLFSAFFGPFSPCRQFWASMFSASVHLQYMPLYMPVWTATVCEVLGMPWVLEGGLKDEMIVLKPSEKSTAMSHNCMYAYCQETRNVANPHSRVVYCHIHSYSLELSIPTPACMPPHEWVQFKTSFYTSFGEVLSCTMYCFKPGKNPQHAISRAWAV